MTKLNIIQSKSIFIIILIGIFLIVFGSCEKMEYMQAEQDTTETIEQKSTTGEFDHAQGDFLLTEEELKERLRERLKEYERDANDSSVIIGEKAWKELIKDWEIEYDQFTMDSLELVIPDGYTLLGTPTPARADLLIPDLYNPPASGSITIQYESEQVITYYTSEDDDISVAAAIAANIQNHPNIQLVAENHGYAVVYLTEKRAGCEYNGNVIYLSGTPGTHIGVPCDSLVLEWGTDDGIGCDPPVPPDPPSTPALKWPPNGSYGHPNQNLPLEWHPADRATSYRLQVALNPSFSPTFGDWSGIPTTHGYVSGLPKNTTVYWRVRASNSGGSSDWSNTWSFKTKVPIAVYSAINTPFGDFGNVHMYSRSWAQEPIDYIDVYATSYRDWILIGQAYDGGANSMNAVAGVMAYKGWGEPPSSWYQYGDHWFVQGGWGYGRSSDDHKNF